MNQTIILLVLFFCHFLADYTHLSTSWMLIAKRTGTPLFPIFCHAWVHGSLMGIALVLLGVKGEILLLLYLLQVTSHFVIDTVKGKMNVWFHSLQSPANTWHWIVFGADQYLHAVIIILMSTYI